MRMVFGIPGMVDGAGGRRIAAARPDWELIDAPGGAWLPALAAADVAVPIIAPVGERELAGARIRLVQQYGVGLDTVDLGACRRRGVAAANVPSTVSGNAEAVAEIALALALDLARQVTAARGAVLAGAGRPAPARSLAGRRVVLVGLGGLGAAIAARLAAFGVQVLAVRAHPERGGAEGVASVHGPAELDALLGRADGVVLAAMPGGDGPLFTAERLQAVRRGAWFVNVARGVLVDEAALLAALDDGTLSGAGLDVVAHEPASAEDPVVTHPRTIVLPHIGGVTVENLEGVADALVDNIGRLERGEPLRWTVA